MANLREIKFRGKSIEKGEWVYGCLVNNMWFYSELSNFKKGTPVCEIITGNYESDSWEEAITEESNVVSVIPYTVGQFTGLKDKNGKEIYQGDILTGSGQDRYIKWSYNLAAWVAISVTQHTSWKYLHEIPKKYASVKGNIHNNEDLWT